MKSIIKRFEEKFLKKGEDECWEWLASKNYGYGQFRVFGTIQKAHRISYELYVEEIPNKMSVLHKCDNPFCVNPHHLFLGTQQDNVDDMINKGRKRNPTGGGKLTERQVLQILSETGLYKEIGKKYGVTDMTVLRIKKGYSWKRITGIAILFFASLLCFSFTTPLSTQSKQTLERVLHSDRRDTVCLQYMTVAEFKRMLAQIESGGLKKPYQAVNRFGYTGKYQLSRYYIEKYSKSSYEDFLVSPWIQERTMNRLVCHYLNAIHLNGWDQYIGQSINGVNVTLEGLLGGYHQHPVALKLWLESNGEKDLTDGNKIPVSTFISHYGYNLCQRL